MIVAVLICVMLVLVSGIVLWCITDWHAIDESNKRYYVDGYHIYYDRKIIQQMESENSQNH